VRDPRLSTSNRGKTGKTKDDFVLNVDLAPTMLGFAGVGTSAGMQRRGRSCSAGQDPSATGVLPTSGRAGKLWTAERNSNRTSEASAVAR